MKWGDEFPKAHDRSSLRLLGSVGEPINPEAWMWYRDVIGEGRCPIVDTWWQTETGGIMATPLPGVTATKPGAAMRAFPGISLDVVDHEGTSVGNGGGGFLVVNKPWPGMTRGIWGDPKRFQETYWAQVPGRYFAGDGAKLDDDGDLWILGRIDDVMNVSGHRLSTAEVEHALVAHASVAEAAVVGATDETTGQAVVAFVTLRSGFDASDALIDDLRTLVSQMIGPIAKPKRILVTPELPKTRSGKIMRRLLRDVAEHRSLGDTTTLLDPSVLSMIDDLMRSSPSDD
jgi:acetyl-CoA synthetase